ncbi:F-box protein At3g07870-like [Macadamia integrifolia]|uniref:F-box protein At3g07870-like n=1 Tax=Macadamia integrifolia TaxID=60698 RepID=UPI001C4E5549|nr:F-box protein At3g07870-like [Macadamia integrifolia]
MQARQLQSMTSLESPEPFSSSLSPASATPPSSANQQCREVMWSLLPSEIEENILSRLPMKSLMRFRCVCKDWCSLVTKHHFIKMQFNHSTQIQESSKIIFAYKGKVYYVDVEDCVNQCIGTSQRITMRRELVLPFRNHDDMKRELDLPYCLKVSGSCNGLLCLSCLDYLRLLNPVTKEYKRLPYPRKPYLLWGTIAGFGYCPRTDEYKVVVIIYGRIEQDHPDAVYACTLRTNSCWRYIGCSEYKVKYYI